MVWRPMLRRHVGSVARALKAGSRIETIGAAVVNGRLLRGHVSLAGELGVPEALHDMVVHHAHGLHERVTDGGTHEAEAGLF